MFAFVFACAVIAGLFVLPLLLLGLALRLVIGVALLPLRLVGLVVRLALGLSLGLVGLVLAGMLLLVPLLPVIALCGAIWLLFRLTRRHPVATAVN